MSDEEAKTIVQKAKKSESLKQRNIVGVVTGVMGAGKTMHFDIKFEPAFLCPCDPSVPHAATISQDPTSSPVTNEMYLTCSKTKDPSGGLKWEHGVWFPEWKEQKVFACRTIKIWVNIYGHFSCIHCKITLKGGSRKDLLFILVYSFSWCTGRISWTSS